MEDKLSFYDIMGILLPGALLTGGILALVTTAGCPIVLPALPDMVSYTLFLAVVFFLGQAAQAVGSVLEPLLFLLWGGKPSTRLLDGGTAFRGIEPKDGARVRSLLRDELHKKRKPDEPDAPSTDSLFSFAMSLVNHKGVGRVDRFNALYAYHRALLTSLLLLLVLVVGAVVFCWASSWPVWTSLWPAALVLAGLFALMWHRTRQRAYYFAREVIFMAEVEIRQAHDGRKEKSS